MPIAIVDLSYLVASKPEAVRSALQGYTVLVTFELIYEMMTNSRGKNPRQFLDKLAGLDVVQARPLLNLVWTEVNTGERVDDVVDPNGKSLADFISSGRGVGVTSDVEASVRDFYEKAEPQRLKDSLDMMWKPRFDDTFSKITSADVATDAHTYLRLMRQLGDAGLGRGLAEQHKMRREPSPGWLIYEWEQLRNFRAFHFRLTNRRSADLPEKKLANDLLDLTYLAFLPHVQAIATQDTKLVVPLAQAFGSSNLTIILARQESV
jgi:hypothetical protein